MSIFSGWFKGLGIVIGGAIAFSGTSTLAQISPDSTLSNNSQVTTQGNLTIIEGGTRLESNLFHSFKEFSVLNGAMAEFKNTEGIQNIISRVTGKSISNIDGILKANGAANLFLINPNGIIFSSRASLDIGGSFIASTASSLNFADGTKFSATEPLTTPLLTVSVPIGLQFGATAALISNQSQAKNPDGITTNIFRQAVGLQVKPGKTLALVGGDITLEGGNLTAASGRIELGSVASNSLVSLKPTDQGWSLGYEGVQNFQNIQIIQRIADGKEFPSQVDASGEGGGNIQVQANFINLTGQGVRLINQTTGSTNGKDLTITARKLIVQDGARVATSTRGKGAAGNLTVNASESVELIGSTLPNTITGFIGISVGEGKAGDITINTGRLRIKDGARVTAESSGVVNNSQVIPSEGRGGNITVNALESVEIAGSSVEDDSSGLFASTLNYGNAGTINMTTGQLIVRDGGQISVSVKVANNAVYLGDASNPGTPGALNVTARSILLDEGTFTSNSQSNRGGDIGLQVGDLLLMRRNSQISTNAGGDKTGGNITINAPNGFLVATPFGNNDITANGFSGSGGKITITAKNIFGFVPRTGADVERLDPTGETNPKNLETSDITAFSQQNPSLNGTVQINSPDADPSKGLVELPVNLVDASQQIAASCSSGGKIARNSFITTGRGGLVADPTEPLIADDAVLADWIAIPPENQNRASGIQKIAVAQAQRHTEEKSQKVNFVNEPTQIVEAQGWVMDANGNVVLVAQVPTESPHNSSLTATSCAAH
ncbi:two-partner secretion domain-containing protein [Nostoc sp. 'Peltigera malacea cyanobiont' DB3992]|uniref:two-partner secretion domain-containing protein n=1 Tax=Nostoc sp. 'Peltigera malacea cyanobiont' DB3992 TaxID=1206980 RepID=UPI000C042BC1|nr:filamentous hemagglutinin N-terminal domain-containing protein [Nostoc sp. 'Peltigera malacea cyanobiont' DB3992]PHM09867.1 filamentous hemagglutinin [Nostoc sp. 'Peltigera malacea cyanobiont' DB3992]